VRKATLATEEKDGCLPLKDAMERRTMVQTEKRIGKGKPSINEKTFVTAVSIEKREVLGDEKEKTRKRESELDRKTFF